MSNKIEEKVNSTFNKATPDISQSVIADCKGTTVYRTQPTKRSSGMFWKVAALAMAFMLVISGVIGGVGLGATAQAAVVALDVNPSIQLKIDGRNRIKQAIANNQDAQIILQGMDLAGSTLDTAIYAIIGSMTVHGYLSEYTNSVLVSVDTKKESTYNKIVEAVTSKIQVTLKEHNINSSVVAQWLKNKDVAGQIANQYNISMGKAQLIAKIIEASSNNTSQNATVYTAQDLVNHSVNELALIYSKYANDNSSSHLTTNGIASEKAYIGKEQALAIALEHVGISGSVNHSHVDFDIVYGLMVYEVEFVYDNYKYEIDVNAVDGQVSKVEKQLHTLNEAHDLPNLTDEQLIAKATEGIDNATNAIITERESKEVEVSFQAGDYYYQVELTKKGTVISVEKHLTTATNSNILTQDKIKQIALDILSRQFSFLDDQIEEIECELSDDGTYYEVEIEIFGLEFEFCIDAKTGEPLRFGGYGHGNGNKD